MDQNVQASTEFKSARSLLEKIAGASDSDVSPLLIELSSRQNSLSEHEIALARVLGWLQGEPNFELLRPEDFTSGRLKYFYFTSSRCHLSLSAIISLGLEPKGGTFLKMAKARLSHTSLEQLVDASSAIADAVIESLAKDDRKRATTLIKNVALVMAIPLSAAQAKGLLEALYARFDPNKKSTWPKALTEQLVDWLTLPVNRASFDEALGLASGLSPASYGNILIALSRVRLVKNSGKLALVRSIALPRDRSLVTAFAQANVLDDFTSEDFGIMISDPVVEDGVASNQRVTQALRDAIERRLRKDDPADVLYVSAKFPGLATWCDQSVLAKRISALKLPLLEKMIEDAVMHLGVRLRAEQQAEVDTLKLDLANAQDLISRIMAKAEEAEVAAKAWEDRLRANVNSGIEVRDEELRVARAAIAREFIGFIDDVQRSKSSEAAITSLIQFRRKELGLFGIRVEGAEGDLVVFDPRLHDGDGVKAGEDCIVQSPTYLTQTTDGEIVVKKASVLPR